MDTTTLPLALIGIDIGKEVFHIVGLPPNFRQQSGLTPDIGDLVVMLHWDAAQPSPRSWITGRNSSGVMSRVTSVIGNLKRLRPALPGFR
jgi:hypothetical protein